MLIKAELKALIPSLEIIGDALVKREDIIKLNDTTFVGSNFIIKLDTSPFFSSLQYVIIYGDIVRDTAAYALTLKNYLEEKLGVPFTVDLEIEKDICECSSPS